MEAESDSEVEVDLDNWQSCQNLADTWIASLLTSIIMKHERDDGAQGTVRGSFWVCGTILTVTQSEIRDER